MDQSVVVLFCRDGVTTPGLFIITSTRDPTRPGHNHWPGDPVPALHCASLCWWSLRNSAAQCGAAQRCAACMCVKRLAWHDDDCGILCAVNSLRSLEKSLRVNDCSMVEWQWLTCSAGLNSSETARCRWRPLRDSYIVFHRLSRRRCNNCPSASCYFLDSDKLRVKHHRLGIQI